LTEKDRIKKAKISLNKERPFFSYILMSMHVEQSKSDERVPTMGVNKFGRLYWNVEFTSKLADDELMGVMAHEAMHMAMLTFERENKRDHILWNIATDAVINYILVREGLKLPYGVLVPNSEGLLELDGKDGKFIIDLNDKIAEDVYDELLNHAEEIEQGYGCGGEGGSGNGNYKGSIDSHLPGDQDSEGNSTGEDKGKSSQTANANKWKKTSIEASTMAKMRGTMSSHMDRMLNGIIEPKIDWRKKLNTFMTKEIPIDYTMRRPGRRYYSTGVYFPSTIRENLEIIVGLDISGSISDEEYAQFISECVGIANGFQQISMRLIWWACDVHPEDDIKVTTSNSRDIIKYEPKGGGGTTMSCFADHIKSKGYNSRVYVILTDGFIEDNPRLPDGNILYVLSKNGSDEIIKKSGEVCKLSDMERN